MTRLDEDEKGVAQTDTPGGSQTVNIINEPGLYNLILRSDKPQAKQFKRWVTHDVLPVLRKTGSYSIPGAKTPDHLAQLRRQRMQINAECALIKALRRLEKTARDEGGRILRGSNDIEDYNHLPALKHAVQKFLETTRHGDPFLTGLEALVEAYHSFPHSFSSTYGLVMEERSDDAGNLVELRLTASTRELFQAFRALEKTSRMDCPFKSTSQMGAELKKSEAVLRGAGWRIDRNVKKVRGSRKHACIRRGAVLPAGQERGKK